MTETRDDNVTWLTQEAYDRLKAELDYLSGAGRTEIAKKNEAAKGFDVNKILDQSLVQSAADRHLDKA